MNVERGNVPNEEITFSLSAQLSEQVGAPISTIDLRMPDFSTFLLSCSHASHLGSCRLPGTKHIALIYICLHH